MSSWQLRSGWRVDLKRRAAILLLGTGGLIGCGIHALHGREPSAGGLTLSRWLRDRSSDFTWIPNDVYGHVHDELWTMLVTQSNPRQAEGATTNTFKSSPDPKVTAVRSIGTNALPWLIQWMSLQPTFLDRMLEQGVSYLPARLMPLFPEHASVSWASRASRWQIAAFDGFTILGTNGSAAVPALGQLLESGQAPLPLTWALANLGPEGVEVLARALAHSRAEVRDGAALALGLAGDRVRAALPALVDCVLRGQASGQVLGAIGRIGGQEPRLVSALSGLLDQPGPSQPTFMDQMALLVLGLQGQLGQPALSVLVRLYCSADHNRSMADRRLLRRVIRTISPETDGQLPSPTADEMSDDWP